MAKTSEVVRITNPTDRHFDWKFDGTSYPIRPHSEQIVPWGCMCLYLGNPNSRDIDSKRRYRTKELARLRVRYGAYENSKTWEANKPNLEAYTIDGDPITTVVDDPNAEPFDPTESNLTEVDLLRRRQQALEEELAALRGQMNLAVAEENAPETSPDTAPRPVRRVEEPPPVIPQPGPSVDDRYEEPIADPSTQTAEPDEPQRVPVRRRD